jgi:hypothetical protein
MGLESFNELTEQTKNAKALRKEYDTLSGKIKDFPSEHDAVYDTRVAIVSDIVQRIVAYYTGKLSAPNQEGYDDMDRKHINPYNEKLLGINKTITEVKKHECKVLQHNQTATKENKCLWIALGSYENLAEGEWVSSASKYPPLKSCREIAQDFENKYGSTVRGQPREIVVAEAEKFKQELLKAVETRDSSVRQI